MLSLKRSLAHRQQLSFPHICQLLHHRMMLLRHHVRQVNKHLVLAMHSQLLRKSHLTMPHHSQQPLLQAKWLVRCTPRLMNQGSGQHTLPQILVRLRNRVHQDWKLLQTHQQQQQQQMICRQGHPPSAWMMSWVIWQPQRCSCSQHSVLSCPCPHKHLLLKLLLLKYTLLLK